MVLIGTTSPFKGLMALIVSSRSIVVISRLDEVLGGCRVLTEGAAQELEGRKMERLLHGWAVSINPSVRHASRLLSTKGAIATW
jgi:hypothetical protein